jgi:hypothetical protein
MIGYCPPLPRAIYEGIDANTAVTKWAGERMDLGMAVEGLLRLSRIRSTIGSWCEPNKGCIRLTLY